MGSIPKLQQDAYMYQHQQKTLFRDEMPSGWRSFRIDWRCTPKLPFWVWALATDLIHKLYELKCYNETETPSWSKTRLLLYENWIIIIFEFMRVFFDLGCTDLIIERYAFLRFHAKSLLKYDFIFPYFDAMIFRFEVNFCENKRNIDQFVFTDNCWLAAWGACVINNLDLA